MMEICVNGVHSLIKEGQIIYVHVEQPSWPTALNEDITQEVDEVIRQNKNFILELHQKFPEVLAS